MSIDFKKVPSPCYVLDENLLRNNLQLIQRVKEESGAEIIVAFKGFAMWGTFPIVKEYIHKAAASSIHEAHLAVEELGAKAHTYSPAYTEKDFDTILKYSSHITFNSLGQFSRFIEKVNAYPEPVSVGLRINPEYSEVDTDLYNPCAPGSRLGVIASQIPEDLPLGLEGFHFHTLCESTSFDLEKTLEVVEEKFGKWLPELKWLNMGGGHLMTKKGYDIQHLVTVLKTFNAKYPNLQLILEPGSAFGWETGVLVSSIVDIVENHGIKTAILDVSFSAHMPDCLEMPYQPQIRGAESKAVPGKHRYRMGGNSCLSGDFMGFWSFDEELQIGGTIIFEDMIHYTMVKTTTFNGVPHPCIGIYTSNGQFNLLKKFGYEDYKNRLS